VRTRPARNGFSYRAYFLALDLDELDELGVSLGRFAHNGRALVSIHDVDHGPRDGSPLRPWIDGILARAGLDLEGGRVELLTFPRVWGFRFFPVSFWYCYHADGTPRAVLAEVQNTFRDHHNYLLHNGGAPYDWNAHPEATKVFYVSPFVQLADVTYRFGFSAPAEDLRVSILDTVAGEPTLTATLDLHAEPLTDESLLRVVRGLGPISARALVLIHYQALKLVVKRVPFNARVRAPLEETTL
jgi:DUF1365 family protein